MRLLVGPRGGGGGPRVCYGRGAISAAARAHGGLVKLQGLRQRFPDRSRDCNILYMVSSAPPPGAPWLAAAAQRSGVRVVWNQNGVAYPAWYGEGFEEVNAPMARIHRLADHVFYQSEFCRVSAERYLGRRNGPWEVLHNAVDTRFFAPSPGRSAARGPTLILAGTHKHRYRVEVALDALLRLRLARPDARLLVAGLAAWRAERRAAVRELGEMVDLRGLVGAVEWLGPFSQAEAPDLLRRADILLHTQYNDCCPGIVLEAMACGLPVVYSRSGGVPELVGDEAGVGVETELSWEREIPPDPERLAEAALAVSEKLELYSKAARDRVVARFDSARWLDRHAAVFEALLG